MVNFRTAKTADIPMLRALWQECFGDSDAFCHWFFSERFAPALSTVAEEEGKILSAVHGWPFTMQIRNKAIPSIMMCGVATLPSARGKGLMKGCISIFMNNAREQSFAALLQKPVDFHIYDWCGHYPSYDAAVVTKKQDSIYCPANNVLDVFCSDAFAEELLPIYEKTANAFSNGIIRSLDAMSLKLRDYAADGGRMLLTQAHTAYAVYYITDDRLMVPEIMGSHDDIVSLMHTLAHMARHRELTVKLPANAFIEGFTTETRPWGAMSALNVPALLKEICGYDDIAVQVDDPIIPQNNGTFAFDGSPAAIPHLRLDTGRLMQLLSGYCDIRTLAEHGNAELLAPISDILTERLPALPCFTVDEY